MDPNYAASNSSNLLTEAPGSKGAKICGILSIVFAATCVGFPVALVLAIVALVLQAKAKRAARDFPQDYAAPTNTGMVTGIIGLVLAVVVLPILGIISAIAIPALLGQRSRARDKASISNMQAQLSLLLMEYDNARGTGLDSAAAHKALEERLKTATDKNPWNIQAPAYRYEIAIVSPGTRQQILDEAEAAATEPGVVVFVMAPQPPDLSGPAYLAGAVRMGQPNATPPVFSKAIELD
jgi:type II secretory pathway pseudopilin PulG